jgi:diguanylate cyclase (GGDEF)-like protein
MIKLLKNFWGAQDTLERKMFWSILVVVTVVATCSAIFTIYEGLNFSASLASLGCAVLCFVIAFVAVKTALYNQCYLVMCCALSCFLMPMLFLFCGGITSGMPLYCITSLALIAFATRGAAKRISFFISLIVQATTIYISWKNPSVVFVELDRDGAYLDILVTHILTGITLFAVGSFSLISYVQEREKREKLVAQLDYLSVRDSLTGLYNRRYLLKFLEETVWKHRNEYFIAMFDLDNFKQVNSKYGHTFGDTAICTIGKLIQKSEDETSGEIVTRFGCEKFIYLISAGSEVEAYAKVESIRKAVRQVRFEEHPELQLTISGGLLPCNAKSVVDTKQLLFRVDELVVSAKNQGKNQIRNMVEN